jgi:hypothetical protein
MVAIGLLFILTVVVACAGGVGFLLGYFVGRRSGAKERQVGFPVMPVAANRGGDPMS